MEESAPVADDHDKTLAALFDPVPVEALEKMFPAAGAWGNWAQRVARNGLEEARQGRAAFNPYKAEVWFVNNGAEGWGNAQSYRTLASNLLPRSLDDAHQLTGDSPGGHTDE